MLTKLMTGLFTSMILVSILGMGGCATKQNSFEQELKDYEMKKQMEMKQ